jgi:hypothetical protein
MAQHRNKEEWNELLIAYENRDGTQIEFCEETGISPASLGYHLRKATAQTKATKLVEIKPSEAEVATSVSLDLVEFNCHHSEIGSIMIRTRVDSLAEVINQLKPR